LGKKYLRKYVDAVFGTRKREIKTSASTEAINGNKE
jgi:hypothetical protein